MAIGAWLGLGWTSIRMTLLHKVTERRTAASS